MIDPPFLSLKPSTNKHKNNTNGKQMKNDKDVAIHPSLGAFFKNRVSNHIRKLAYDHKSFPDPINNNVVYLDYHLRGKYLRGNSCRHATSHVFLQFWEF